MGHFSTFTEQSNTKKHPILTFLTWLPFNQPTPNQPVLTHFCSTQFTQVFIMKYISEELAVIFWIKYFQTFKNAKPGRHFSLVSCLWFEMFTADRFCLSSGRTIKANQRQIEDRGEKISSRLARFGLVHPADIHWIAGRGGGGRRIAPARILLSSSNTKTFFCLQLLNSCYWWIRVQQVDHLVKLHDVVRHCGAVGLSAVPYFAVSRARRCAVNALYVIALRRHFVKASTEITLSFYLCPKI